MRSGCRRRSYPARLWAALLAVGEDGLVSHLAAAGAYEIRSQPLVADITTPRRVRSRPGIRVHSHLIDPAEVRELDGLPSHQPLTDPLRPRDDARAYGSRLNVFLRKRGFPPWKSNVRMRVGEDVIEPDVLWRKQRVIVEADGRDPHLAPLALASDPRRDRRLSAEGWRPVRVTSSDLDERPDEFEQGLWTLLAAA